MSLQASKKQDSAKDELKKNASMRLNAIKSGKTSVYSLEGQTSMTDLKASAAVYHIPEFSVPEVNFEVADKIKSKVEETKNDIISHLPEISKSSNFNPKKLEHQLNHRSAVRGLEDWLREHLRRPPQSV